MHNWFECKIRYEKLDENGKTKKITEPYLVDALSFTEAEARICKEMEPYISGEYSVSAVKRANIHEMFENASEDADRWYRAKVNFVTIDEEKGIEKRTPTTMMVQAGNIFDALTNLKEGLKDTMADYEIVTLAETMIMDVYKYGTENNNDNDEDEPIVAILNEEDDD